eukprot:gene9047-13334_t
MHVFVLRDGGKMRAEGVSREDALFRTLRLGRMQQGRELAFKDLQWMVDHEENNVWPELGTSRNCSRLSKGRFKDALRRLCPAGAVPGRLVWDVDARQHSQQMQAAQYVRGAAAATTTAQTHVAALVGRMQLGTGKVGEKRAGAIATATRRTAADAFEMVVPGAPRYANPQRAKVRKLQVFQPYRWDPEHTEGKRACVYHPGAMRHRLQELIDAVPGERFDGATELAADMWAHADGASVENQTYIVHLALVCERLWPNGVSAAIPYLVVRANQSAGLLEVRGTHIINGVYCSDDRPNVYESRGVAITVRWRYCSADNLEGWHILCIWNQAPDRCIKCDLPDLQWGDSVRATPRTMLSLLREWEQGKRATPPRLAQYLIDQGMCADTLGEIALITPVLHIVLNVERPLIGALPQHVPAADRQEMLPVLRAATNNAIDTFSADKLTAGLTCAKVRNALASHRELFRDSNATGLIRCAWAIGSLLNA